MSDGVEVPKGSVAVGTVVRLPPQAEPPFTVFINGVEQREGPDYRLRGREIVFNRPILKEKVGTGRWRCTWGCSAPTASTRRWMSSTCARARSS
jgi:hypothetical protein